MSCDGCWGDHVTLQAAADTFGAQIHVFADSLMDSFIDVTPHVAKSKKVLQLSFWSEIHYNSLEVLQ
eukprot:1658155-Amphidinium_carterae.2